MVGALWAACQELTAMVHVPGPSATGPMFFREPLLRLSGEDPCELVHQTLIPLAAAFLDRGEAQWTMPDRMQGFYLVWEDIMTADAPESCVRRGVASLDAGFGRISAKAMMPSTRCCRCSMNWASRTTNWKSM